MTELRVVPRTRRALLVSLLVLLRAPGASGQGELDPQPKTPVVGDWKLRASFEALYDNNVYRLSDDSIERQREERSDDAISGRFDDMNSAADVRLEYEVELRRTFTDSKGNDFGIAPGLRLLQYLENPKKTHPEFFLEVRQELQPGSTLHFNVEYRKDVFVGNYLADVTDLVGSVSDDERRYDAGVYDQWSASVELSQRLWRRSKESWDVWRTLGVRRLDLDAEVGGERRWYYSPFSNRDVNRLFTRLRLTAEVTHDFDASFQYELDLDRTDNGNEVLIRDEDDFGIDFNGDGDRVDQDVRAVERVDRSRNQHEFEARLTWRFAPHWSVGLRGTLRLQDYLSDEPVDTGHRDRIDRARELRLDLKWTFVENWQAFLRAGIEREKSNRDAATTMDDQEVNYHDAFVGLGVNVKF
jgi:lipopolysaccharide assembly outer membrane protein LptD (OstA)